MSQTLVARRYAKALSDLAKSNDSVDQVDGDVEGLVELLKSSRELSNFFRSPIISRDQKASVLDGLFGTRLGKSTLRFLRLLVAKRREDILSSVLAEYRHLRDKQQDIERATTRSAQPLPDAQLTVIQSSLERMTGNTVRLEFETDASLIGGLVVQIGDTVYDGSVRNKLNQLRDQFAAGSHRIN